MLFPNRLHGIELHEHPRCPRVVRDGATDYLQFIIRTNDVYGPLAPILARALSGQQTATVVDLCSGGGGPWPELRSGLVAAGAPENVRVVLTDLFPNRDAFSTATSRDPLVTGELAPVNVEHDRIERRGLRTLFSSFHHFSPPVAVRVLRNIARDGDGIMLAEVTERKVGAMAFMLLAPLLVWLATPMLRPVRLSRYLFTYLLPLIPFVVCFDGIVSCLRTYTPDELRALFRTMDDLPYDWDVGQVRARGRLAMTYAIGTPRARAG